MGGANKLSVEQRLYFLETHRTCYTYDVETGIVTAKCSVCGGSFSMPLKKMYTRIRNVFRNGNGVVRCNKCVRTSIALNRGIAPYEKSLQASYPEIDGFWKDERITPDKVYAKGSRVKYLVQFPDWESPRMMLPCNMCGRIDRMNKKKELKYTDLTGMVFGRLTVLSTKNKDGSSVSTCRCSCGNIIEVSNGNLLRKYTSTKSCGCIRNSFYNKSYDTSGYVKVYIPLEESYEYIAGGLKRASKTAKGTRVQEHIMVMAKHLGRPIDTQHESVHHKNGVRSDNRIENLELRSAYHGSGQGIEDKIKYARDVLLQYDPVYRDYMQHLELK